MTNDKVMVLNPDLWPARPLLPLMKKQGDGSINDCGYLKEGHGLKVFLGNILLPETGQSENYNDLKSLLTQMEDRLTMKVQTIAPNTYTVWDTKYEAISPVITANKGGVIIKGFYGKYEDRPFRILLTARDLERINEAVKKLRSATNDKKPSIQLVKS